MTTNLWDYIHEMEGFIYKSGMESAEIAARVAELHALQAASRDDSTDADLADFARRIGFIPPNQ